MALSSHDYERLKPLVERAVDKFLGAPDGELLAVAMKCLDKQYESRTIEKKLTALLEDKDAKKFTDRLLDVYEKFKAEQKPKKRREKFQEKDDDVPTKKQKTEEEDMSVPDDIISPGQLTADKIKEMMANAQKMIQERKAQLNFVTPPPTVVPAADVIEKSQRASELQAQIQARMANVGLPTGPPVQGLAAFRPPQLMGAVAAGAANNQDNKKDQQQVAQSRPTPLILDEYGRTLDMKTGEMVQLSHHVPTLKANIRAQRREQFKKELQEKPPTESSQESHFYDPRVAAKGAVRQKRGFNFHEKGKFEQLATKLRTKAQLERLQSEIAQAARKTGILSAAKLACIQPKKYGEDEIPDVEWWDSVILPNASYPDMEDFADFIGITNLVEHPTQMQPPCEGNKEVQIQAILTQKERKKLRRQRRMELQKEQQEKIRLGLLPAPEPKVKMANLMRVLGTEAVQDPTKIEAHVRAQMAKRLREHEQRNAARKLNKKQIQEKKLRKIKEDTSTGVHVSVYRVSSLSDPSNKFKVETNSKQLTMTGVVVLHKDCNVVVVEGGPKQQKKFRRLMLQRIKWNSEKSNKSKDLTGVDGQAIKAGRCHLVWEGEVKNRSFGDMKFKLCPTESFAREQFRKAGVEHYWDLSFSGAVLEAAGEEL